MYCGNCGAENEEGSIYCKECGHKINQTSQVNNIRKKGKRKSKKVLVVLIVLFLILVFFYKIGKNTEQENSQTSEEIGSVWSTDYLFAYIENSDMGLNKYAKTGKKMLEKAAGFTESYYAELNSEIFGEGKYSITCNESEYRYSGELKKNQPSGFGVLSKLYDINSELQIYLPVYIGEFSKGKYDGDGIKFYDFSEDEITDTILGNMGLTEKTVYEYIDYYFQQIEYIDNFKKGLQDGKGVTFVYPSLILYSYEGVDDEELDMKNINIFYGLYKKGKMNGKGKVYSHKSLVYEGEFKNDMMDGKGTAYYPDSEQVKYKGEWENNAYSGKGTLYNENGDVEYKGNWENGDYAE